MKCFCKLIYSLSALIFLLCPAPVVGQASSVGDNNGGYERDGNRFVFSNRNADVELDFYSPSVVRVRASWQREFGDRDGDGYMLVPHEGSSVTAVEINEQQGYVQLTTAGLQVRVLRNPFAVEFRDTGGNLLSSELLSGQGGGMQRDGEEVLIEKRLFPDEHFFGFGERMDFIDQRGKRVELNVGRGIGSPHIVGAYNILDANYSPVPFFMSTRGYGVFFHNPYATEWDMGYSDNQVYSFKAAGGEIDYFFMYGPGFPSILDKYTDLTGKSPLLPEFAHGLNVGTYSGGTWGYEQHTSTDYVVNLGRRFRDEGIPVDVLHLDSTWRIFGPNGHGSTTFEWRETFDDPAAMFESLYEMDYNMVGVHVRPRYDNGREYNLLAQAREEGMVYPEPNNSGEFVNFFDPEAIDWWWENGAEMVISQGAMFFKTDEGSAFGHLANESNRTGPVNEDTRRLHNIFPIAYAKVPYERFKEENNMRGLNLTREGYAGIQRYPYIFAGDWPSEWQYFAPVIKAGLNIGLSGVGYWAHCMGGFEHPADPELYIRWTQFGLMSPVAHLFGMDHPGYKEPWNYGEEAQEIFTKYDRLRYRMLPYIYSEAYEMHKTGMPLMRALVLEYQDDLNVYDIGDQYLFGSSLLIAPVTTKGAQTRVVYLPEGQWVDYWSGEEYSGKQYMNVVTPLDMLPMYVKAGSIIPKRNNIYQVGELPADTLTLEIFPSGLSSFSVYDDDGKSEAYMDGQFAITDILVEETAGRVEVEIAAPEGDYDVPERSYELVVRTGDTVPEGVEEGGSFLDQFPDPASYSADSGQPGWYYDSETGVLQVRLSGTSSEDISVRIATVRGE